MPKGEAFEMDGTVIDALPRFTVSPDNGLELLAYTAGACATSVSASCSATECRLQMSPYDLTRGRVRYRLPTRLLLMLDGREWPPRAQPAGRASATRACVEARSR